MIWTAEQTMAIPADKILTILAQKRATSDTTGTFVRNIEIPKVLHGLTGGNDFEERVTEQDGAVVVQSELRSKQAAWTVRYEPAGDSRTHVRTRVDIRRKVPELLKPVVRALAARRFRTERGHELRAAAAM